MSLQERMSASILQKLNDMKKNLPKVEPEEKDVFTDEEEEQTGSRAHDVYSQFSPPHPHG